MSFVLTLSYSKPDGNNILSWCNVKENILFKRWWQCFRLITCRSKHERQLLVSFSNSGKGSQHSLNEKNWLKSLDQTAYISPYLGLYLLGRLPEFCSSWLTSMFYPHTQGSAQRSLSLFWSFHACLRPFRLPKQKPPTGWLINNRNGFLTVPEAGDRRLGGQHGGVRALSQDADFLLRFHAVGGGKGALLGLFSKGTNPIYGALSSYMWRRVYKHWFYSSHIPR